MIRHPTCKITIDADGNGKFNPCPDFLVYVKPQPNASWVQVHYIVGGKWVFGNSFNWTAAAEDIAFEWSEFQKFGKDWHYSHWVGGPLPRGVKLRRGARPGLYDSWCCGIHQGDILTTRRDTRGKINAYVNGHRLIDTSQPRHNGRVKSDNPTLDAQEMLEAYDRGETLFLKLY